jgi:hypothetical protein
MKTKFIFIALLLTCFFQTAFAKEEILATITNDENNQVTTFMAQTNEQTNTITSFYKDNYVDGKKTLRETMAIKQLTLAGVVLDKRGDNTVINLKSDNFDNQRGGDITIDTLYNGINGERKEYEISLSQTQNGWKLFNANKPISKIHVEVNKKMFIGSIGVKNIKME